MKDPFFIKIYYTKDYSEGEGYTPTSKLALILSFEIDERFSKETMTYLLRKNKRRSKGLACK